RAREISSVTIATWRVTGTALAHETVPHADGAARRLRAHSSLYSRRARRPLGAASAAPDPARGVLRHRPAADGKALAFVTVTEAVLLHQAMQIHPIDAALARCA